MREIVATAPGRICIAGEKLDWMCGGKGITCTLDRMSLRAWLKEGEPDLVRVYSHRNGAPIVSEEFSVLNCGNGSPGGYVEAIVVALNQRGIKISQGMDVHLDSSIPQGVGLSSSAALCTAVVAVLSEHLGLAYPKETVAHIAYIAEKEVLGVRCGQMDQYAVTSGGLCRINSAPVPAQVTKLPSLPEESSIVIGDPGVERKTDLVNLSIQSRLANGDRLVRKYIDETTEIVSTLTLLLLSSVADLENVGREITRAHFLLSQCLGVSTDILDSAVKLAISAGAYGAKLGSGKGGVVFALCNPDTVEGVSEAFTSHGLVPTSTRPDSLGLVVKPRS